MSKELWEKVTDNIDEKYINEASEYFAKHSPDAISDTDGITETAHPTEIKPSPKKSFGIKHILALAGAAAAIVLCIAGISRFTGSTDPITSSPDETSETTETDETTEHTEPNGDDTQLDTDSPVNELEYTTVLLPPYELDNYVFDTNDLPFAANIGLPKGWYIEGTQIYDADGSHIGSIEYNWYEIYPEAVGADNYYQAVYNQIMMGNVINYGIDYTPVTSGSGYENAISKKGVKDMETGEVTYTPVALAYNDSLCNYIFIDFFEDIDEQLLKDIARSIQLARDKRGTAKLLCSAFNEAWEASEQDMMLPQMYAINSSVAANHSLFTVFVPTYPSYSAYLFTMEDGQLKGVERIFNINTMEIYYDLKNECYLLHVVSEYSNAVNDIIEYEDSYYTYKDHILTHLGTCYRAEDNGTVTRILQDDTEISYDEYLKWKISMTSDCVYIRYAQFPQDEDKLVDITEDMGDMEQHFLSALNESPTASGYGRPEEDALTTDMAPVYPAFTYYPEIAENFCEQRLNNNSFGIFIHHIDDNEEYIGIYYPHNDRIVCHLYHISGKNISTIGRFENLTLFRLYSQGIHLRRQYFEETANVELITDSYAKFVDYGAGNMTSPIGITVSTLDDDGTVTATYTTDGVDIHGTFSEVSNTAYTDEQHRLADLLGNYYLSVDDTTEYPYTSDNLDTVLSYLFDARQAIPENDENPNMDVTPAFAYNNTDYYADLTIGAGVAILSLPDDKIVWSSSTGTYFDYAESLSELTPLDIECGDNSLYLMPDGIIIGISKCTTEEINSYGAIKDRFSLLYSNYENLMYNIICYQPFDNIGSRVPDGDTPLPAFNDGKLYYDDPSIENGELILTDMGYVVSGSEMIDILTGEKLTYIDQLPYVSGFNFITEDNERIEVDAYDIGDGRLLAIYLNGRLMDYDNNHFSYTYIVCCRKNEWWNNGTNLPEPPALPAEIDGTGGYELVKGTYSWESLKYGIMHHDSDASRALTVKFGSTVKVIPQYGGEITHVAAMPSNPDEQFVVDDDGTLHLPYSNTTYIVTVNYPQGVCEYYLYAADDAHFAETQVIDPVCYDYIVLENGTYYSNMANADDYRDYEFVIGEHIGEILYSNPAEWRKLSELPPYSANQLLVGTKLYEDRFHGSFILAQLDDGTILPYIRMN